MSVKELTEYGMLAEFLGRLPVMVQLEPLGEEELYQVLTVPPDSLVREYRELLAIDEVELDLSEGALREVVRYALDKGVGARGLRSILEEVMSEVMFEAPELHGQRLRLDAKSVRGRLARLGGELVVSDR